MAESGAAADGGRDAGFPGLSLSVPPTLLSFIVQRAGANAGGGAEFVDIGNQDWNADFPIREEVEDHAGKLRAFVITCHEGGLGFTVRATEDGAEGTGHEYAAYSETSPYSSLGRLRQKIYRGLATRHISGQPGGYRMLHDRLSGRITSDGKGGVALIVDGVPLGIDDLASNFASHEGWVFELQIVDALE